MGAPALAAPSRWAPKSAVMSLATASPTSQVPAGPGGQGARTSRCAGRPQVPGALPAAGPTGRCDTGSGAGPSVVASGCSCLQVGVQGCPWPQRPGAGEGSLTYYCRLTPNCWVGSGGRGGGFLVGGGGSPLCRSRSFSSYLRTQGRQVTWRGQPAATGGHPQVLGGTRDSDMPWSWLGTAQIRTAHHTLPQARVSDSGAEHPRGHGVKPGLSLQRAGSVCPQGSRCRALAAPSRPRGPTGPAPLTLLATPGGPRERSWDARSPRHQARPPHRAAHGEPQGANPRWP